jgi:ATP-dependent Clp protease ATP-binding subunit ClpA
MLDEMKEPLSERNITLTYDKKALENIAEKSYDKKFGARDIRKVIRSEIEDKVSSIIIDNTDKVIEKISVSADGENLIVDIKE